MVSIAATNFHQFSLAMALPTARTKIYRARLLQHDTTSTNRHRQPWGLAEEELVQNLPAQLASIRAEATSWRQQQMEANGIMLVKRARRTVLEGMLSHILQSKRGIAARIIMHNVHSKMIKRLTGRDPTIPTHPLLPETKMPISLAIHEIISSPSRHRMRSFTARRSRSSISKEKTKMSYHWPKDRSSGFRTGMGKGGSWQRIRKLRKAALSRRRTYGCCGTSKEE